MKLLLVKKVSINKLRLISLFWAIILMTVALIFDEGDSAIVIIGLKIASYTYGGLLTLFILTKLNINIQPNSVILGLIGSIIFVFIIDKAGISWTWFTLFSTIFGISIALAFNRLIYKK